MEEGQGTLITFFMIVTDRDISIADYAVKSYCKIRDFPFRLRVYSNWVSEALRRKYFAGWQRLRFVDLIENDWQTDAAKPVPRVDPASRPGDATVLLGPFELPHTIWDTQLRVIETPYHATVDADFEILDPRFITIMLRQLEASPKLVAMSTSYSRTNPEYYDSYSNDVMQLNERWPTWFCIYKREALRCPVSYRHHEEIMAGKVKRSFWDDAGYFQKALRDELGYELAALDPEYGRCFIHYGAFAQNRTLDNSRIGSYRRLRILRKRGLFGAGDPVTRRVGRYLLRTCFAADDEDRRHFGVDK